MGFPMMWKVLDVSPGLPSHDCILLIKLGIGGIGCDIAVGGQREIMRVMQSSWGGGPPQRVLRPPPRQA